MRKQILAVFLTLAVLGSVAVGPAAAAPGLNFTSDKAPDPTIVEDELEIAEHDRSEMSDPLEYYDDQGEVATLDATVNDSQDTPVGVRFDKIDAESYDLFPRIDGESENSATWTTAGDWSTTDASVSDADADGIDKLEIDATAAGGNAVLSDNVSVDDSDKRVLFSVINVDTLPSSAEVQVRMTDSDGDYRYANISESDDANADHSIANATGNGYVFQEKVGDLPMAGSGDGNLDEIQSVEVHSIGGTSTVTVSALDLDKKSETDLAEIQRDTDGDGELEATTVTDIYEGGTADLTGLDTLGDKFDDAVINDLSVYDVEYRFSDLSDEDDYSTEFSSADAYNYPQQLELYGDIEVPTAIDLSHGSLTMEFDQGLVSERYKTFEIAEDSDSDEAFGNISNSDYSSVTDSLQGENTTAEVDSSVSADTNYRVHMVIVYQDEEVSTLQDTSFMGPTGSGDGGFFSTVWGQITGFVAIIAGALGLNRFIGGE